MKEKVAIISILANIILASSKISIGVFSNSVSILASGIDSLIDIFSSIVSYIGIKISAKPEDKEHPYGHYKFEVLSGLIITVIVIMTGMGIIYSAFYNFFNNKNIIIGYLSFSIMIFSIIVNEIMSRVKIYYGKKEGSISLISDGIHSRIDVYTSIAIFIGLFITRFWIYTDIFLALLIGFYIIKESFPIGKDAIGSLLDVSAGKEIEDKIMAIASEQYIKIISLKTQRKGSIITANLEIEVPNNLIIEEVTKISDNFKNKLIKEIDSLKYVVVQIASYEVESCLYKSDFGKNLDWHRRGNYNKLGFNDGLCVCSNCGYNIKHTPGIPCSTIVCPKCKINLERK